jgi:hypothetical protein
MSITKRKKYGVVISIIVFFIIFAIAFISSVEVNRVYEKINENTYIIKTIKQIQPFNYNTNAIFTWLIGIIIIFITVYVAFVKRKEKDINKVQMIVLATFIPIILFISFLAAIQLLDISTLAYPWFFTVVMLILIAIFEYDLFGNKTIISFFDFKFLIKMIFLFTILFSIIGLLGELIPPFTKTTTSPITKDQYEKYKGKKLDWSQIEPPKSTE